jgi:hypothetical protein
MSYIGVRAGAELEYFKAVFLGLPDPDPEPLVRVRIRIWLQILPFSHKGVEQTDIMLAK